MKAIEIKPGIYWVGGKDWNLRDFHGYTTERGSTYNAYLIMDETITLVDTVKSYLCDEMVARIRSVVDPSQIKLIVSNHVEMDHSGSLPAMLKLAPQAEVLTSVNGEKGLKLYFDTTAWKLRVVDAGKPQNIGKRTLQFYPIPLVHWPDSMATYIPEDKLLLPNDAFGQHIVSDSLFDDECGWDILLEEAARYYANIVLPYGSQVEKALATLAPLDVDMIGPSHGKIWRTYIPEIIEKYKFWSSSAHTEKAVVVYDTMWGSTETMANSVQSAFQDLGVPVVVRNLKYSHISDIVTDVLEAKYVVLGSPTLNNVILPTMGAFLTYLKGLKPKNKIGFVFGSYGWNPNALLEVEELIKNLGWSVPQPGVNVKFKPQTETLETLKASILALSQVK